MEGAELLHGVFGLQRASPAGAYLERAAAGYKWTMPQTRTEVRMIRPRVGGPKAKQVFTECWKSCSQVFAESKVSLSGVPVAKTSRAESTICTVAMMSGEWKVRGWN